jgi:hypothetical protein
VLENQLLAPFRQMAEVIDFGCAKLMHIILIPAMSGVKYIYPHCNFIIVTTGNDK